MSKPAEDERRAILRRRGRFVAAALASTGLACGGGRPAEAPVIAPDPVQGSAPVVLDAAADPVAAAPDGSSNADAVEYAVRLADLEARVEELKNGTRARVCLTLIVIMDAGATVDGSAGP